ncbi:hypothetical protein M3936_19350 [Sutcliffiella horikoshii]|uniref:hypothetical protein n=1 Tax=Sutcliffiella horikoshii TaxID=79883 RepID=UPI001CBB85ED|nr:hypothetical protein [Sutcliffiella horikoshii]MCM3619730.1 hypothetical protein [Sutcliffiella horikoshii]UAL49746.1 hypothetical protein K7887_22530 [Sutcliffiella horikoshii]
MKQFFEFAYKLLKGEKDFTDINYQALFKPALIFLGIHIAVLSLIKGYIDAKTYNLFSNSIDFGKFISGSLSGVLLYAIGWGVFLGIIFVFYKLNKQDVTVQKVVVHGGFISIVVLAITIMFLLLKDVRGIGTALSRGAIFFPYLYIFLLFISESNVNKMKTFWYVNIAVLISSVIFALIGAHPFSVAIINSLTDLLRSLF